jgi:O-antigen/teichoic acid export membrane protein
MSRHVSVIASLACNYLATASLIVCSLAIVPIAIRHLGDVGYGTWLGLTALAAVGSMADMGVSGVLVVRLSRALEQARHGEARAELFNGLAVSALSSIVGGLIVLGSILAAEKLSPGSFATSGHNLFIAVAVAITAAMSQFSVSLTALPTSQLRPIVTGAIGIAAPIAWLLASVLLLPRFGVMGLAIGLLVRSGVTLIPLAIYNAVYLSGHGASGGVSLDLGRCRSFAVLGTLGLVVRWIQSIQSTFDVVCVSTTQGPGAAALYANTARPTGMATGLANAFGGALLPAFTRFLAREQGPPAFRLFFNSLRLTVIMAGALAISFVSVRRQFLTAWVGAHFILPAPLTLAIATAAIASTALAFASYMFGSTGKLVQAHGLMCVEGVGRIALMACGASFFGSLGLAVAATPTPLIATSLLLVGMARFTDVRIHAAEWLTLAVDVALILAGLAAASMLPEIPLHVWQIPLVAAACGGVALLVLTLRSAPLRQLLLEVAHAVLPAAVRQVLPPVVNGVRS